MHISLVSKPRHDTLSWSENTTLTVKNVCVVVSCRGLCRAFRRAFRRGFHHILPWLRRAFRRGCRGWCRGHRRDTWRSKM
jgi:hypothetical protein